METLKSVICVLALATLSIISFPKAEAQLRERPAVECSSLPLGSNPRDVSVRIDRSFGSSFQNATVRTGELTTYHTVLLQQTTSWTEIRYWGNNFDLAINMFMENGIKYNTPYDATLQVSNLYGGRPIQMRCEFLRF